MTIEFSLPMDEMNGKNPNIDLIADYLELSALFSNQNRSITNDLISIMETGADRDYEDVDEELSEREDLASRAARRIDGRCKALGCAYPFELDENGDILRFAGLDKSYGRVAYAFSLLLSNLESTTSILKESPVYPSIKEIENLRKYFQYFATAALAAELNGRSWSFGAPRPDGSNFHDKMTEIWAVLRDGHFKPDPSAPASPKDDGIDVFAARPYRDGLPGFLLAAGQVATGKDWREKSLRNHLENVFLERWIVRGPATSIICYHIVPYAIPDAKFSDDCRNLGYVLHRIRVPLRVAEAKELHDRNVPIEAFDKLPLALDWIERYLKKHKK